MWRIPGCDRHPACWHMGMNLAVIAFIVMATVTVLFAAAILAREMGLPFPARTQTGDTTLSPQSVNWLAASALILAVLICLA
jgi:hypothetical protein